MPVYLDLQQPALAQAIKELLPQAGLGAAPLSSAKLAIIDDESTRPKLLAEGYAGIIWRIGEDAEADIYLPLSAPEFLWRLQSAIRSARPPLRLGPWLVIWQERKLQQKSLAPDQERRLTEKEIDILAALAAAPKGLTREALLADVWGYKAELETHTLETNIYRLRQKLEQNPSAPQWLLTTEQGYCLNLQEEK